MLKFKRHSRGDTIVEVLLAIGIAAFAIGFTYATASRSLNQAITANERNQALNLMQNQITALQIRYNKSTTAAAFSQYFASPKNHFCLDDTTNTPGTTTPWTPYFNSPSTSESSPLQGGSNPYNDSTPHACVRSIPGEGAVYYIDIQTTTLSGITQNPTVYQVFVRWDGVGGGREQASVYYRANGPVGQRLGYSGDANRTIADVFLGAKYDA